MSNPTINQLARIFCALVCQEFDAETLRVIRRRNREAGNDNACATHDFCDANLIMATAFELTFGRAPKVDSDGDAEIWSNAWDLAVKANYELRRIKA